MSSFFEKYAKQEFDFANEANRIKYLFMDGRNYFSLHSLIDEIFINISNTIRMNNVTFDDLVEKTNVFSKDVGTEEFFDYCEVVLSIFKTDKFIKKIEGHSCLKNARAIVENINYILKKLGFVRMDDETDIVKICPSSNNQLQAAEIVKDTYELGSKIYIYRHSSMKGSLNEKKDILCRLWKFYETKRDKIKDLRGEFITLDKNIGILSNKADVRHNKKQSQALLTMSKKVQEDMYDKLFDLFLYAIVISDYIESKNDTDVLCNQVESLSN